MEHITQIVTVAVKKLKVVSGALLAGGLVLTAISPPSYAGYYTSSSSSQSEGSSAHQGQQPGPGHQMSTTQLKQQFDEMDSNGDGVLSFEEFKSFVPPQPPSGGQRPN